ncbi:MAG: thiamine-phosphate kinase [Blastomonas sp.]
MTSEPELIRLIRGIARHPAARGLADDAAVWEIGGERLVLTHDSMVESVHFLPGDPAEDVAWKLVATNMSDLAAKGARPLACLMAYGMGGDAEWDRAFVAGLGDALDHYGAALLGGDSFAQPDGNARCLGLTAIGKSSVPVPPSRSGAQPGDILYVTGAIGNGWAGLQLLRQDRTEPASLIAAYRRPRALIAEGVALAQIAHAMMDVSDGLLLDAARMAAASGLGLEIALDRIPLSPDFCAVFGTSRQARLDAATGGDDYQLLFAAHPDALLPVDAHPVGRFAAGNGLSLTDHGEAVPLPENTGWLHHPAASGAG